MNHRAHRLGAILAGERASAREHLEEHGTEGHTSARLSTLRPRACSGLMYAAVPRITPISVMAGEVIVGLFIAYPGLPAVASPREGGAIALAKPKSSTFTVPSDCTLMFAGFKSRRTIPCSCAASRASAICFAMRRLSSPDPSARGGPTPAPAAPRGRRR